MMSWVLSNLRMSNLRLLQDLVFNSTRCLPKANRLHELQGLKFENRAFDSQSVSFEKETEEREGEDREEIVNDTGNSVC